MILFIKQQFEASTIYPFQYSDGKYKKGGKDYLNSISIFIFFYFLLKKKKMELKRLFVFLFFLIVLVFGCDEGLMDSLEFRVRKSVKSEEKIITLKNETKIIVSVKVEAKNKKQEKKI